MVLFISLLPLIIATENQTVGSIVSVGYGKTKIFSIHPQISKDSLTLLAILPFLGRITITKPRFSGHIGRGLLFVEYRWFENKSQRFSKHLFPVIETSNT